MGILSLATISEWAFSMICSPLRVSLSGPEEPDARCISFLAANLCR